MVKQNRCGRGTNGLGGKNEFLLLQAQDLAAHNTGHIHPVHAAQGNNDALDAGTQHLHDQDNIQRQGNGGDNIHNTHHDHIHGAAQVTGNTAVQNADDEVDERSHQGNQHGNAGAVHQAGQHIAAQGVSA